MAGSTGAQQARFSAQARLRALQAEVMELILDRNLMPGDPLPTENDLSTALGVGRNTLREALKVLQALGVIEIRHGFGMFVARSNFEALVDGLTFRGRLSLRHQGIEALQLVEVRQSLESGLIGHAMEVMGPEHLGRIEAAVARIEELAARGENFAEADMDFHSSLFDPLGNDLLTKLMDVFRKVCRKIHLEIGDGSLDLAAHAAVHREIYRAVECGDKALAAELLNRHFDGIRQRISAVAAS